MRTPIDLFAFGSKTKGPRVPRVGIDIFPDDEGMIGPELLASANGASTFGDVAQVELTGAYFRLPAGTELPDGLDFVSDGRDVKPSSTHPPTHHTIFPVHRVTWERFVELFAALPWHYAGKKS